MTHFQADRTGPRRRTFLAGVAASALAPGVARPVLAFQPARRAEPFPLSAVRLSPSIWLDATEANLRYLHGLDPDRLLHNFRVHAGLAPRAEAYGGWEGETIAGHTLGHYLTALSLMHAQTGDALCRDRAGHIVSELAACQAASGDGYTAGFTRRKPDGGIEDGKAIFAELTAGDIRAARFYLNGSWAPFYNWHKLFSGLLAAHEHCGSEQALTVAVALAAWIERALKPLSGTQMQAVLETEHGGMNDALAELAQRTGEARWLRLAERFNHQAVLGPLMAGQDALSHLHANTQIPKVIGLARQHALTGDPARLFGARFFWDTVTHGRTYVIGGNSDREYFQEPNSLSLYVTEQTCESCNTYNMLKLTRRLYGERAEAARFDYFERAHLNHIMAHQRPSDGAFIYMAPLISGAAREFSTPTDSFWCCVGSGMESHAKHGESVWWSDDDGLIVNLFIASELTWSARGGQVALESDFPYGSDVGIRFKALERGGRFRVRIRLPAWAGTPTASVNGKAFAPRAEQGYLVFDRRWRTGDLIRVGFPMSLRVEPTPDDPDLVALLHGPMVLAADLGPATDPFDGSEPALLSDDVLAGFQPADARRGLYRTAGIGRPRDLDFSPFYALWDRRAAVYFRRFTPAQWEAAQVALAADRAAREALEARSVDFVRLGVEADEAAHRLESDISYAVSYRFRPGRDARTEGFFAVDMGVAEGPMTLQTTCWGGERDRLFHIEVDGVRIATQRLHAEVPGRFFDVDYPVPPALTAGKDKVRIRIVPESGHTAGPLFGLRVLRADA
ncbi:glycoside hydrolase family 127 protein [Brevundimonas sp.]|uniref:glycoside hydrolase family 127 protein n=1 Tax=Brevundimonas sp. TaxID=1871086 RepID=UPI002737C78E|nr:glycoside hydrolase family 127 protein [Brevundimonas sp.]MDP3800571.1 glycoside hydrolase family 127 protein [Brevundimonas sp.]